MTTTQERVYLDAQNACGLKIGDWVMIEELATAGECGWYPRNYSTMATTEDIGEIGVITMIGEFGFEVKLQNGHVICPYFALRKVEKPAHKFKPFDRVLVRDDDDEEWKPQIFSCYVNDGIYIYCTLAEDFYAQCIPYEGNEHLAGTTKEPENA